MRISDWSSDVCSSDLTASAININGGKVSGNVSSTSQGVAFSGAFTSEDTDTYDTGVFQGSTSVSGTQLNLAHAGGDASVALQGSALVTGNVSAIGGASASAAIGSAAKVEQDVFVDRKSTR